MTDRGLVNSCLSVLLLMHALSSHADELKFSGEVGLGVNHVSAYVSNANSRTEVIPYINAQYGRLFARIDTLGVELIPFGWGHIEAVAQIRTDGYKISGQPDRADSRPIGFGTLQMTSIGAFGLQILHDLGASDGNLVQARYLAEVPVGRFRVYPEVGAEYQDWNYLKYYRGNYLKASSSRGGSKSTGLNPYIGVMVEADIAQHWVASVCVRHKRFSAQLSSGSIVGKKNTTDIFASVAYRF